MSYSWYGMGNNYNMMKLYTEYATELSVGDAPSAYFSNVAALLDVTDNHLIRIILSLEW